MKTTFPSLLIALGLCLITGTAGAEKADRHKTLVWLADQSRSDELNQTYLLSGNVTITKGSLVLRGERVEVREDAQGYQHVLVTATPASRAFFRQKREGVDEHFEGEAETIEYDGQTDKVKLMQRAELRRLRGSVLADSLSSSVITYDNANEVFSMEGQANPGGRGGQTKGMLTPKNSASAPSASNAGPTPALRPSPGLAGDRK